MDGNCLHPKYLLVQYLDKTLVIKKKEKKGVTGMKHDSYSLNRRISLYRVGVEWVGQGR